MSLIGMSNWVPKSAKPDRSEIGPYLGGPSDYIPGPFYKLSLT